MATHNIGSGSKGSSYPDKSLAGKIPDFNTSLGVTGPNGNAFNYDEDPPVFNASPATKKSYSWNKGETGNAT